MKVTPRAKRTGKLLVRPVRFIKQSGPNITRIAMPRVLLGPNGPMRFMPAEVEELWVDLALPLRLESKANARGAWQTRHASNADQRGTVLIVLRTWAGARGPAQLWGRPLEDRVTLDGTWPPTIRDPLFVQITRVAPNKLDRDDNLPMSCKSVRDGIADWLGIDDRSDLVRWSYDQRRDEPRTYGVEIRIGRWR
jgi:hypothetical protein